MPLLLAVAPLLIVVALLASGRAGALMAGAAGLAATVLVILAIPPADGGAPASFLQQHALVGAWLAWQVIAIVVGGIFFYRCVRARELAAKGPDAPLATTAGAGTLHRRLYFACFLLGPFAEAVTGFGVGYIIALAMIARLGVRGVPALVLGLYSQCLVPWGALAIGTTLGAQIAGLAPTMLGEHCALLQAPIHAAYLALFWHFLRAAGVRARPAQCLDDIAWSGLSVLAIGLAHDVVDVEIAGAAPLGVLVALRWLRDERPDGASLRHAARAALPYIVLTLALVATRMVPPLQATLKSLAAWQPLDGQAPFAPFYAPGFWLLLVGAASLVRVPRAPAGRVIRETAAAAWRPSLVTLLFVVMAAFYVAAGMAAAIAGALHGAIGSAAALAAPLFAAVGGFLTGSGAASNAMLMPMQAALAREAGLDPAWMAAVQNGVTANLTMLSPIRVAMGAAILALPGGDGLVYRAAWMLALPPVVAGIAAVAWLLAAS